MKIAHIVCAYPPYYSGMGTVVFEMVQALTKLGHDVTVFTPQYYPAEEVRPQSVPPRPTHEDVVEEKISAVRRLAPSLQYGNAARIPQLKSELDFFDLVHLHYPFFGTANIVRKWKRENPQKPLVVTYHMDARGSGWKGLFFKYYSAFWMPRILGAADKLTVSSFDYLESSLAAPFYRAHKEKWLELPFGVDLDRFQPREKSLALANSLNLNLALPTILFVGGMDTAHYFKGVPIFLRALAIIQKAKLNVQALLVGDGELREGFELQARGLGLDSVRFLGRVDDDTLPSVYNLADLFVLPSVHQGEAFGLVLLEAFASGVPVIATDLPGVRTVASDGGLTVQSNDPAGLAEAIIGYFSYGTDQMVWRKGETYRRRKI